MKIKDIKDIYKLFKEPQKSPLRIFIKKAFFTEATFSNYRKNFPFSKPTSTFSLKIVDEKGNEFEAKGTGEIEIVLDSNTAQFIKET